MDVKALDRLVCGLLDDAALTYSLPDHGATPEEIKELQRFAKGEYQLRLPEDFVYLWSRANGFGCDGALFWPINDRRGDPFPSQGIIDSSIAYREIDPEIAHDYLFVGNRDDTAQYVYNARTRTWQDVDPYAWTDVFEEFETFSELALPPLTDLLGRRGIDITESGPYA